MVKVKKVDGEIRGSENTKGGGMGKREKAGDITNFHTKRKC